jgi:hypothetical protein
VCEQGWYSVIVTVVSAKSCSRSFLFVTLVKYGHFATTVVFLAIIKYDPPPSNALLMGRFTVRSQSELNDLFAATLIFWQEASKYSSYDFSSDLVEDSTQLIPLIIEVIIFVTIRFIVGYICLDNVDNAPLLQPGRALHLRQQPIYYRRYPHSHAVQLSRMDRFFTSVQPS